MARVKNISGEDRILDGRLVLAGQIVDVPDDDLEGLVCQETNWSPTDKAARDARKASVDPEPDEVDDELEAAEEKN